MFSEKDTMCKTEQRTTTTTIDVEDYNFIKNNNLSVAEMIRQRCGQIRADETAKLELAQAHKRIEGARKIAQGYADFIIEIGKWNDYVEWEKAKQALRLGIKSEVQK